MAAYCTADDVRQVLARDITKASGTAATLLDVDVIDYHIGAAQAEVDGRLAGRYLVPFTTVPALVKALTVDVAAYLATLTYRQSKSLEVDDPVRLRYQRSLDILKELSTGTMDLPVGQNPDGPQHTGAATVRNPYIGRLFGAEDFGLGWQPPRRSPPRW